jgi:hypothetical protein
LEVVTAALFMGIFSSVFLAFGCFAAAQNVLRLGEPVEGTLDVGRAQNYMLPLHAGDYIKATLEEQGAFSQIWILAPNGSRSRKFNVDSAKREFWWAPDHKFGGEPTTETGWLAKEFIKSPKLALRFYMDAGLFEIDFSGSGGGILEPSRQMRDVLLAKGYEVHYQEFASGHDCLNWRGTLADGLITLIGVTQSAKR